MNILMRILSIVLLSFAAADSVEINVLEQDERHVTLTFEI